MTKDFLRGMGAVIELFPLKRDEAKLSLPQHSDEEALYSDWKQVGDDLCWAAKEWNDETTS